MILLNFLRKVYMDISNLSFFEHLFPVICFSHILQGVKLLMMLYNVTVLTANNLILIYQNCS